MSNIAIIGGGASGIVAAIAAAENQSNSVTIYEKGERIGKKILVTGNGRCNMTNIYATVDNYHGNNPEFIKASVKRFWVEETLEFFKTLGIVHKVEDNGKVYPYSDQASAVLDVLRTKLEFSGVTVRTGFEAESIKKKNYGFLLKSYKGETAYADRIIVATGGKAAPNLGSNGSGYEILKKLGHSITDLYPSLVQITTETEVVKKLKGIKVNAKMTLGEFSETGEVLFTDYGLSGPPVFSLSSRLTNQKEIIIDIMSEYSEDEIIELLRERIGYMPYTALENFLVGMLNKRVGQALLKSCGIVPLSRYAYDLSEDEIIKIAKTIKNWKFKITGTKSWNNAQVTRGGVKTYEFNEYTFESKLVDGLYATGEILDIDGDCGGYNLQWAWTSGYIAGKECGGTF